MGRQAQDRAFTETLGMGIFRNDYNALTSLPFASYHDVSNRMPINYEQGAPSGLTVQRHNEKPLRAVVFGLSKFQGLGVPDLFVSQGIAHIEFILRYSHHPTHLTGQLIRASMEQLKLESGCNSPVFALPYKKFGHYVTSCWLSHLWEFLSLTGGSMEDDTENVKLLRE